MCEPISMIMMGLTAASSVAGLAMSKTAKNAPPPTPKLPERAVDAPVNRNPAATVRLGTSKQDETDNASSEPMYQASWSSTRRQGGNTLGNLGKSTLI